MLASPVIKLEAGMGSAQGSPFQEVPALSGNHSLLVTGEYSDMIIFSHGRAFKVHRAIVCTKSQVIKDMVDDKADIVALGDVDKYDTRGIITLDDIELESLEFMLEYMYLGCYAMTAHEATPPLSEISRAPDIQNSPQKQIVTPSVTLLSHTKIHILAARFKVEELKALTAHNIAEILQKIGDDGSYIESLALMFQDPNGSGLRSTTMGYAARHYKSLIRQRQFYELVSKHGNIAARILVAIAKLPERSVIATTEDAPPPWHKLCPSCRSDKHVRPNTKKKIDNGMGNYFCENSKCKGECFN